MPSDSPLSRHSPPWNTSVLPPSAKTGNLASAAVLEAIHSEKSLALLRTNDPGYADGQRLQGTWDVVSCEIGGTPLENASLSRFVFTDAKVTVAEKEQTIEADYGLEATKQPKEMVFSAFVSKIAGEVRAIYSLGEDNLLICFNLRPGARMPSKLETTAGDGRLLVALKRAEKNE